MDSSLQRGERVSRWEYFNRQYEEVDKKPQTIKLYAGATNDAIARIEKTWRAKASHRPSLYASPTDRLRYCEEVEVDPYHTLKRRDEGRLRNFLRWYCETFRVKKVSSIETYWHNLSQLYMKWKDGGADERPHAGTDLRLE